MEQQLGVVVAVSHVSVLQVLVAYFRSTPVEESTGIEIPMHTVLKFVPLRGGGWLETHHPLTIDEKGGPPKLQSNEAGSGSSTKDPIWGDSRACLPPQKFCLNHET
jgi:hypothetical protein